jgi:hypothetical protein
VLEDWNDIVSYNDRQLNTYKTNPIEQQIIDQLKIESLLDSLQNLKAEGRAFEYPSGKFQYQSFELKIPLLQDDRRMKTDLMMIISNRRVAKLLEELNILSKAEAGRLLGNQIRQDLALYRMLTEEYDVLITSENAWEPERGNGYLGYFRNHTMIGDNVEIFYLRLSLLSHTLIAGVLELFDVAEIVLELSETAKAQREWFYNHNNNGMNWLDAYFGLTFTGLYNPAVLTTALAGTGLVDWDTVYDIVSPTQFWKDEDITLWDASISVYGAAHDFTNPDFSRGRITVHYATEVSDEQFDTLLDHARGQQSK